MDTNTRSLRHFREYHPSNIIILPRTVTLVDRTGFNACLYSIYFDNDVHITLKSLEYVKSVVKEDIMSSH